LTLSKKPTQTEKTQKQNNTMKIQKLITSACFAVLAMTANSQATILFSDNFTVGATPDSTNINYNLAGRQAGTSGTQNWNGFGTNAQVGNTTVVGQPGGTSNGDYLLLAYEGKAALTTFALNSTTVTAPLLISFDMFNGTNPNDWTSFTLTDSVPTTGWGYGNSGFPVMSGYDEIGFRKEGDGTNGNSDMYTGGVGDHFVNLSGNSFSFLLTGTDGTGSAFAGNGTQVKLMNGATIIGTYNLAQQMTTSYITFGANVGQIGGIDNLLVQTVPEPSTWVMMLGGLGMLTMFRRRRA
jgi:hypothetical protein